MGIRQQLTELSNRPEGNTFEVWEEADGSITATLGGSQVVVAETNPLTGGMELSAGGEVIELGSNPDQLGYRASCTFGTAGDSLGNAWGGGSTTAGLSPIYWAAAELYPCDFAITFNSSVGGTSASHIISNQIATLEALATKPDVMVVQTLQNDYINTKAVADANFAYLQQYSERALVAGVKLVVLCSHPPKSSAPDVASALGYLNRLIENYCRTTPGNFFCDVFSVMRQGTAADTSGVAWRGTANTANAFSDDGTHWTGLGSREIAPLILPVLQRYARPVTPRPIVAVAYDDVNWPYNNLLGNNGMMLGTSGQYNAVNNANVAGNSAGAQDRWYLTDGNGILATPTIVTGADGYLYQQLVLSGTASADAAVALTFNYVQNVALGDFIAEAIVETENLTGIKAISFSPGGMGSYGLAAGALGQMSFGTKRMHFRKGALAFSNAGFANKASSISLAVENGATVSGTIRIGRVGIHRI